MMNEKDKVYFPIFIDLMDKHIMVIGAGKIAARRVKTLLDFAGKITVVAPEFSSEMMAVISPTGEAANKEKISLIQSGFQPEYLEQADMVLAATNDEAVNQRVAELCRKKNIMVNSSSDKTLCDFYFPGIVKYENVVIGVTASGKDHGQAKKITEQIKELFILPD